MNTNMLAYFLAGTGAAIGGEGSAASAIGGMTQGAISTQNYAKMLQAMIAGGGKLNMDKDNVNIKAPASFFGEGETKGMQLPSAESQLKRIEGMTSGGGTNLNTLNPSSSPLDISGANLVGLTPQDITQALQLKMGVEELRRKTVSDITETAYKGTAMKKMEAETKALTPSVDVPGFGKLTRGEALDWYKTATKDERTAVIKGYEYARDQGYEGTFEQWATSLAKASAMNLGDFMEREYGKKKVTAESKLSGPDFAQNVREDLMKDKSKWGFPPTYESFKSKGFSEEEALETSQKLMIIQEMDSRIKAQYGDKVERRKDGWYVGNKRVVRNPYGGK